MSRHDDSRLRIVTLCTGNVARSVMLGYMLTTLGESNGDDWHLRTAGTHVVEGSAMSGRTRDALLAVPELGEHRYGVHRSHQLTGDDVTWADVVIATEARHVTYARTHFAHASTKTASLGQFVRDAPLDATWVDRVRAVASCDPVAELDVLDPAGAQQDVYDACAVQLWQLAQRAAQLLRDDVET